MYEFRELRNFLEKQDEAKQKQEERMDILSFKGREVVRRKLRKTLATGVFFNSRTERIRKSEMLGRIQRWVWVALKSCLRDGPRRDTLKGPGVRSKTPAGAKLSLSQKTG